jgi:signal transduction histidine kinase
VRHNARNTKDYETAVVSALAETDAVLETFSALLRIAQIEAGTRKAGFRDVNLSVIADAIVQTYSAIVEDVGKQLRARIEPGVCISGDSELLVQLLVNLIENAIRHTPTGTIIDLSLTDSRNPTLIVADDGRGIPESERPRVFERFHRLEQSRTSPGSGLGLSIVAAIADLHGVEIALEDNNPGLRVCLKFPSQTLEMGTQSVRSAPIGRMAQSQPA